MKIYLTTCETHAQAWQHQLPLLRDLWERSSRRHGLVDSPAEADLIIIANIREEGWFQSLRRHPVVAAFPAKCFGVSDCDDWPCMPLLPGVYASAHRKLPFASRYRTGSYALYHSDFRNPFIENCGSPAYLSPKRHLASFTGRDCHPVRHALLKLPADDESVYLRDTSGFNLFTHEVHGKRERQQAYADTLRASKFALCPRGAGASSIRLFEAMQVGVAPVIFSDDWIKPRRPNWEGFAVFVPERHVHHLPAILQELEPHYRSMGLKAQQGYHDYFSPESYFDFLVQQLISIREERRVPETLLWGLRQAVVMHGKVKHRVRLHLAKEGRVGR